MPKIFCLWQKNNQTKNHLNHLLPSPTPRKQRQHLSPGKLILSAKPTTLCPGNYRCSGSGARSSHDPLRLGSLLYCPQAPQSVSLVNCIVPEENRGWWRTGTRRDVCESFSAFRTFYFVKSNAFPWKQSYLRKFN